MELFPVKAAFPAVMWNLIKISGKIMQTLKRENYILELKQRE
jgi:hypothetical protein